MNRINALFEKKQQRILSIFCTAGFPRADSLPGILRALQDNGVDMVEIGMPFSDPTADGPMIQHTNDVAIANGMTLEALFGQLQDIRQEIHIPLVLMGYINPVLQYGVERFLRDCAAVGVDGVIIPDLPPEEYEAGYKEQFEQYGIRNIFLITPQTGDDRIRMIDRLSDAFIYVVSTFSITGGAMAMEAFQHQYFSQVKDLQLQNPCIVGFGIRDKATFDFACRYLNGAIIGTAFLKAVEATEDMDNTVKTFIRSVNS